MQFTVATSLREYLGRAYTLWQQTLAETWPLTEAEFRQHLGSGLLVQENHAVLAEDGNELIGFLLVQLARTYAETLNATIDLIVVAPEHQRQGVGTFLLEMAIDHCHTLNVAEVRIGGGPSYFWPGIPTNLPAAQAFFAKHSWVGSWTAADMARDIRQYETPAWVYERASETPLRFEVCAEADVYPLFAFVKREYADWYNHYSIVANLGDYHDVLLAKDEDGTIIGALILGSPQSTPYRLHSRWSDLLGAESGSIGAVLIAEAVRRRGIGLALVAWGVETLRDRGCSVCHIGWTWLVEWYGRLGFDVWQTYEMCEPRQP